eukprot:2225356-Rhodomonas_salina.1
MAVICELASSSLTLLLSGTPKPQILQGVALLCNKPGKLPPVRDHQFHLFLKGTVIIDVFVISPSVVTRSDYFVHLVFCGTVEPL